MYLAPHRKNHARRAVLIAVVKIDVAWEGVQSQGIADWSGTFGSVSYGERRLQEFSVLREPSMAVVG